MYWAGVPVTAVRPAYQHQGPAGNCVIDGRDYSWLSCTCYAGAMGIDKSSLGTHKPSGCSVRDDTNDRVGGTTLPQIINVAMDGYRIFVEPHVGGNVANPKYLALQLSSGRGAVVQGNTRALIGTTHQSTQGGVNHAIWANETRGGTSTNPAEVLIYDPAADGRKRSYHVDQGPSWWPWSRLLAFAAALRPWGDTDSRTLGPGWVYCGIFPDTDSVFIAKFGGKRTKPFPDRQRADCPKTEMVNVRSTPSHKAGDNIVGHLKDGDLWTAFQVTTTGAMFHGSKKWYGDRKGLRWVHSARLIHEGGTT